MTEHPTEVAEWPSKVRDPAPDTQIEVPHRMRELPPLRSVTMSASPAAFRSVDPTPPLDGPFDDRSRRRLRRAARLVGPLAGAVAAFVLALESPVPFETAALVALALLAGDLLASGREPGWSALLPLMGTLARAATLVVGTVMLIALDLFGALPGLDLSEVVAVSSVAIAASLAVEAYFRTRRASRPPLRVAVIGGSRSSDSLGRELRIAPGHPYVIAGRISVDHVGRPAGEVPLLGSLDEVGDIVRRHGIDLLLMSADAPRMRIFEEVARTCLELPVRLRELSGFYEETFGHVPVAEINAAWFQWIMHPRYRTGHRTAERVLDIVVALLAGLVALPVLAVLALLVRRDGGPAIFRQVRIGENGRSFTIYKMRTMRPDADTRWATAEDDRVTRVGRFMRKTHLDELPQIWNVLKGEMSVVGPRPEQPGFVDRLEHVVPFYQRRHLMKPGLTGWAQVRCGYAGSDIGSAWKVCHDLYYLKHRSLGLNLIILGETIRTLVADAQYTAEPASVDFILAPTPTVIEPAAAPAAS